MILRSLSSLAILFTGLLLSASSSCGGSQPNPKLPNSLTSAQKAGPSPEKKSSDWGLMPYWHDSLSDPIHPPRAIYLNLYWRDLKPDADTPLTNEKIREVIEKKLKRTIAEGPPIAIRFKATGETGEGPLPDWFKPNWRAPDKCNKAEADQQLPAWIDPAQLKAHTEIVNALANALDGDSQILWIEPGSYGYWGEGHVDGAPPECVASIETREALIRPWIESIHKTPLSINMDWIRAKDDPDHRLRSLWGKSASIGLRFDCLGFWHDEYAAVIENIAAAKLPGWSGPWGGEFCYAEEGVSWATGSEKFANDVRKHAPEEVRKMNGEARFNRVQRVIADCQWSYIAGAGGSLLEKPTGKIAQLLEARMSGAPPRDLVKCAAAARIGNP